MEEEQRRQQLHLNQIQNNHSGSNSSHSSAIHSRRPSQDHQLNNWNPQSHINPVDALASRARAHANSIAAATAIPTTTSPHSNPSPVNYNNTVNQQQHSIPSPASSTNFHQTFNPAPPPQNGIGHGSMNGTFSPQMVGNQSQGSYSDYLSGSIEGILGQSQSWPGGGDGNPNQSLNLSDLPSSSSSHFPQSQPQMLSELGDNGLLRIQGIQNINQEDGNSHLHLVDSLGNPEIVTPRPSHQTSVPMSAPQTVQMMTENGGRDTLVGVMGNQGHNELNGIYRSRQEEVQDEIMNSPPRDDEDPSLDQNHDSNLNRHLASPTVQTGLSSSFTAQALSAPPSVAAMGTISQIGQLLDQVVTLANSAREHFKQGEHSSSSSALGDIQRSLAHIGELGSQSLATVQATPPPSTDRSSPAASLARIQTQDLPTHRRTDTVSSSFSSTANSPVGRKRPLDERDSLPSPNTNLSEFQSHHAQSSVDLRSETSTPIHPPSAPPSAPPNMMAASSSMLHSSLAASSPTNPRPSAPPLYHTASASTVPQLHSLPLNGFQQQQQQRQQSFPSGSGSHSVPGSFASSPSDAQASLGGFNFPAPSSAGGSHHQLPQLATGSSLPPNLGSIVSSTPASAGGSGHHSQAQSMPPSPVDRPSSSSLRGHSRGSSIAGAVSPTQQLHQQQSNSLTSIANDAATAAGGQGSGIGSINALQMALQSEAQARQDFAQAQSSQQQQQQQQQQLQKQQQEQNTGLNLGFGVNFQEYQNHKMDGNGMAASDNTSFSAPSSPRDDSYSSWSNTNTDYDDLGGFESSHSSLVRFSGGNDFDEPDFHQQQPQQGVEMNNNDGSDDLFQLSHNISIPEPGATGTPSVGGVNNDLSLPTGNGKSLNTDPTAMSSASVSGNRSSSGSSGIGPRRSPRQTVGRTQQFQGRKSRSHSSPRNPFQPLSSHSQTIRGHRSHRSDATSSIATAFSNQDLEDHADSTLENKSGNANFREPPPSDVGRVPQSNFEDEISDDDEDEEEGEVDEDEVLEETANHEHELDDEGEGMGISIANLPAGSHRKISTVSSEIKALYDSVFHDFLTMICSDPEAADDSGQTLTMTLMPKRVAEQSFTDDFNPFKFRIQPFTDAFESALAKRGFPPEERSSKDIKAYLRNQTLIGRFNESGAKNKTKGTHIWIVEGKKLPDSTWQFKEFTPKFAQVFSKTAHVGEEWTWTLRVWDPQFPVGSIKAVYEVEAIPDWIQASSMVSGTPTVLAGTPQASSVGGKVQVTAVYRAAGHLHRLRHSFFLQVAHKKTHAKRVTRSKNVTSTASSSKSTPRPISTIDSTDESDSRSILTIRSGENSSNDHVDQQQQTQGVANHQQPQMMEGVTQEDTFFHEVVPPSQISAFISSLPFQVPFTPPSLPEGRKEFLSLGHQAQVQAAQQQLQLGENERDQLNNLQQQNAASLMLSLPRRGGVSAGGQDLGFSSSSNPQQLNSTAPDLSGLSNSSNPTLSLSPAINTLDFNPMERLGDSMDEFQS